MSELLRDYYLQQMGIENWVSRPVQTTTINLQQVAEEAAACTRCALHSTRTQVAFARGNPHAKLMVIGEAPGFYEDKQGMPFVGKAGCLLNRMLSSIGLKEEDVYIANVIKCRPPNNRDPREEEIIQCSHYLTQQIAAVSPQLILGVGRFAGQFLLNQSLPLNKMRHQIHHYQNTPCLVSYHPAYLLRNPSAKKKAYADLLQVKHFLVEKVC